jgi:superfamily II DNA or RNA helicase
VSFRGQLTPTQQGVCDTLADYTLGVLVAPTGSGKTVMACELIARHRTPTLIIVDRAQLADQWRAQLTALLGLAGRDIGQLGSGRKRRSRIVDIALFGSVARRAEDPDTFAGYGLVVIDECHHVPAPSFDGALRHAPVRRWLGLTATPRREDGLQAIMTMHCGPVRKTMTRGSGPLVLRAITHKSLSDPDLDERAGYQEFVNGLATDAERNNLIVADVVAALADRRNCLVLTQRVEHLDTLAKLLSDRGHPPRVLRGGMAKKERTAVTAAINAHPPEESLLVAATGPYAGEGFDCPRLDTLFLALPIKSRPKLTQYVGRIMRDAPGKAIVEVHDYDDTLLPIFRNARSARVAALKALGFHIGGRP